MIRRGSVLARVQAFLPELAASNAELAARAARDPDSVDIEHLDPDSERYIEMVRPSDVKLRPSTFADDPPMYFATKQNLGLGVFTGKEGASTGSKDVDAVIHEDENDNEDEDEDSEDEEEEEDDEDEDDEGDESSEFYSSETDDELTDDSDSADPPVLQLHSHPDRVVKPLPRRALKNSSQSSSPAIVVLDSHDAE